MKILNHVQGSGEWLQARLGVITASEADSLVTPTFKARTGDGVETYLYKKLAEKAIGFATESGGSFAMMNGTINEGFAIPWYEFAHDVTVQRVGFCVSEDGTVGCSPDGLIGEDGGLEVKCPSQPIHLRYLLEGQVPACYLPQIHFSMYVTGRKWWKFLSYSNQLPALLLHVERDEKIQEAISGAVTAFLERFDEGMAKINKLKAASTPVQMTGTRGD